MSDQTAIFLEKLASGDPTPGGGAAAAMGGAMGAALVSMVCELTLKNQKYEEHHEACQDILKQASAHRLRLIELIQEDASAYEAVMEARRMPKESPEEKEERGRQVQRTLQLATEAPLNIMRESVALLRLADDLVTRGNPNALSDTAMAGVMAYAAVRGGALNVEINAKFVKDEDYRQQVTSEKDELVNLAQSRNTQIQDQSASRLK